MMMELQPGRRHAVVIGASIAGLATARVLAERFARVTVLERHVRPSGTLSIAPQGRYPHVLLEGGARVAERLFPSFGQAASAAGAPIVDRDTVRWWSDGWRVKRQRVTQPRMLASRALVESIIRDCVEQIPNVRIEHGTAPDSLVVEGERVTGVGVGGDSIEADLVVDCSGRGSRLVPWLEAAGYASPPVTELEVDLGYLVVTLERRPTDLDGATVTIVQNIAPAMTRLGLAIAVEGDRWMVLLGGYFGDLAPSDRAGYLAFADSLPVPDIGQLLRSATPIGEPLPYRFRSSRRVHFERAARWPAGLVALGDATCSFNPLYGQGMSVALMQAEHLGTALDRHASPQRLARSIQRELARITDLAWNIAAGGDLAYPQVAGKRGPVSNLIGRYMSKVFRACSVDAEVVDTLYDVTNLVAPPSRLLRPSLIARVLRARRRAAVQVDVTTPGSGSARAAVG